MWYSSPKGKIDAAIRRVVTWWNDSNRRAEEESARQEAAAKTVISSSSSELPGYHIESIHGTIVADAGSEEQALFNLRLLAHDAGCNAVINVQALGFKGYSARFQGDAVVAKRLQV